MTNIALGPFSLDARNDLLLRGTEPVALGKRAIVLLRTLIERPGELVSKDALIEAAWPAQVVEENNLTVQIAALRRALATVPGGSDWIETMPRRGYRFIGPVVSATENSIIALPPQADVVGDRAPTPHDAETEGSEEPGLGTLPAEAVSPLQAPALGPASTTYGDAECRQITVVTSELVLGTAEPGGTDLEDLREAVAKFRQRVSEVTARRGGFIYRQLGNNVLALFGYPSAQEHDAEQAVRAGLELCTAVRALRPDVGAATQCRVGITTGMVIIENPTEAAALRGEGLVGEAPSVAARLLASAPADAVVIDPATRRLIGNLFDCRDLGAIEGSGGAGHLRSWQVVGSAIAASRSAALQAAAMTPLVGRDEEIGLLLRRWERAKASDGQVVLISGEAGLGKSRIIAELETRLHSEPHIRLRHFCSPHHRDSALYPVVDQLGSAAGFAADDPPEIRLDKLSAALGSAGAPDEDIALLADLLSLPPSKRHPLPNLSPQRKKQGVLRALLRQLEGLARNQPVVVIFEDAHWIDPTSSELLDLTIEHVFRLPVLLVVTFRPEFRPPWVGQPQVTMVALNRLDRRDRTTLVEHVAGGKTLPQEVMRQIVDRADGVPLFVEELTKSVLESGALREEADSYVLDGDLPPFAVPATLHASLLARLDRLGSARHVAQIGAVIGREFSYGVLHAVSHLPEDELRGALADLVGSELVFQRGTPPDAVYSFKHALVQDAAHGILLRRARQRLHARVADAVEAQAPELMDAQPEVFAQHYAEAGLVEKSVACWSKAAHGSATRLAMVEAAAQYQQGLDQLALLPDRPERQQREFVFLKGLGAVLQSIKGYGAPETGQVFARARKLCEQLGFPSEFPEIFYGQSRHHTARGELDRAQVLADDLLRLSRQRDDSAGLVLGHLASGRNLFISGRFAPARSHLEGVRDLYDPISHCSLADQIGTYPHVLAQAHLEIVLFGLGFPDQAMAQSSAAIAEAQRLDHPPSLAASLALSNVLLSLVGDHVALDEQAQQLVAVATEQGFPFRRAMAIASTGLVKIKNGDLEEGIPLLRSGLTAYRATGAKVWVPYYVALLAWAYEMAGQFEESSTLLDEAFQIVERTGERWLEAELHRQKGQLLIQQGHLEAAEGLYSEAISIAVNQDAKLWELRAAGSFARLRRDQGRAAEAYDLLAPICSWFTEGFDTADVKQTKALLDELAEGRD